jgi:hypothetical protein
MEFYSGIVTVSFYRKICFWKKSINKNVWFKNIKYDNFSK